MKLKYMIVEGVMLMSSVAVLTACDDFLDVQPKSQIEDSELFSSQQGYKEALAGVYSSMVSDATYTKELLFGATDVLAQEWTGYPSSYADLVDYNYASSSAQGIIAQIWSRQYNGIANVNNLLQHIDGSRKLFSKDNYEVIKGEALALRAFLHFDLLRTFGVSFSVNPEQPSIPYSTGLTYRVFPQLTVKAAAQKVTEDLEAAAELLKTADPVVTGREITELDDNGYLQNRQLHLNYYAVKGLLARVYMWIGDYQKAKVAAEEVIASGKFSFTQGAKIQDGTDYSLTHEQLFALNDVNLSTLADTYFNRENTTTTFTVNSAQLLNYFDNNTDDYRYVYLFVSGSTGDNIDYRYLKKYATTSSDSSYYANKIPLVRLSEMYLILSEIDYRNGGTGLDALNVLRQQRNVGTIDTPSADYYADLINEYRREFIGEGQLWFLLKRLNRSRIPGSDVDAVAEKVYTFPIPVAETDAAQREDNR